MSVNPTFIDEAGFQDVYGTMVENQKFGSIFCLILRLEWQNAHYATVY